MIIIKIFSLYKMKSLEFSTYDFEKTGYMPPPKPSLNGGLYSGEPFKDNAPWANIPVVPEATYMIHENLKRGNDVVPYSTVQYPATRKGNSFVEWKGIQKYEGSAVNYGPYNIYCTPCKYEEPKCYCEDICPQHHTRFCNDKKCVRKEKKEYLSKYYYVR
jgi:hypothetical protein